MFSDPYLGIIVPFAGIQPPENWQFCQGQELSIDDYPELYTVIGNTFGGNGANTFALPNLCGRFAVHAGRSQERYYNAGESAGNEMVSLTIGNLPAHAHTQEGKLTAKPPCANSKGTTSVPENNYPAIIDGGSNQYSTSPDNDISLGAQTITASIVQPPGVIGAANEPVYIMSPFLTMNYIICIKGLYPSHG